MIEKLARWLDLNPVNASVKMWRHKDDGSLLPASLRITNSSRKRVEHVVDTLIENDWVIEEVVIDA